MSDFYRARGYPSDNSLARARLLRDELDRVEAAMNKMAPITNRGGTLIGVHPTAGIYKNFTAQEVKNLLGITAQLPTLANNGNKIVVINEGGTAVTELDAAAVRTLLGLDSNYAGKLPEITSENTNVVRDGEAGAFNYTLVNDDVGKFLQFNVTAPTTGTGQFTNVITIPRLISMTLGKRIYLLVGATVLSEEQTCSVVLSRSTASPPTLNGAVHGTVAINSTESYTLVQVAFAEDQPAGGNPRVSGGIFNTKAATIVCTAENEYTIYEGLHA